MNFIQNLYGVLTLLFILVSMMNNWKETRGMCITGYREKLNNKFVSRIKKIEQHIISQYKPKNNDQRVYGDNGNQNEDKSNNHNDEFDGDSGDDDDKRKPTPEELDFHNFVVNSLELLTSRYLQNIIENMKNFCNRVWNSCYSDLYPNKKGYFADYEYLLTNERENFIFKDTYYEHIETLECIFNVVEISAPSTSATTNTHIKRERVRFRVAALELQKKFDVILEELREDDISVQNDPRNINGYFQPLYIFNVLQDERCEMHAYALIKCNYLTIAIEEYGPLR